MRRCSGASGDWAAGLGFRALRLPRPYPPVHTHMRKPPGANLDFLGMLSQICRSFMWLCVDVLTSGNISECCRPPPAVIHCGRGGGAIGDLGCAAAAQAGGSSDVGKTCDTIRLVPCPRAHLHVTAAVAARVADAVAMVHAAFQRHRERLDAAMRVRGEARDAVTVVHAVRL